MRENGGQYSHAGVWALMAQAALGDGDAAYRYFTYLSPAHRSRRPVRAAAYAIEPYVMAGDVYSAPPYVGRGGWSWYTGSAAWMHRAAIESMFGVSAARRRDRRRAVPAERMEPGRAAPDARRQDGAHRSSRAPPRRAASARRRGLGAPASAVGERSRWSSLDGASPCWSSSADAGGATRHAAAAELANAD